MTTSEDLAELLENAGIGTIKTDIFPDTPMPDSPHFCVTLNEQGGKPTWEHCNIEQPVIIIAVRHLSAPGLTNVCKLIRNALLKNDSGERRHDFTINSTRYLLIDDHGGGWNTYKVDESNRIYRSRTFICTKGFEGES